MRACRSTASPSSRSPRTISGRRASCRERAPRARRAAPAARRPARSAAHGSRGGGARAAAFRRLEAESDRAGRTRGHARRIARLGRIRLPGDPRPRRPRRPRGLERPRAPHRGAPRRRRRGARSRGRRGCAHAGRQSRGARRPRRGGMGAADLPGTPGHRCHHAPLSRAGLEGAVPRALHPRRRPPARARHLRQSLRDARVHGERRSLRPRGATARVARVRLAHRRLHRGAAARYPLPPRPKAARPGVGRPQRHPDHSGDRALRDPDGAARLPRRRGAARRRARDPRGRRRPRGGCAVSLFPAADRRQHGRGPEARSAHRGRGGPRHGAYRVAGPGRDRARARPAGDPHRRAHRAGAEHRDGDGCGAHRRRRPRDLRLSGDRTDGDRPGAARGDSGRGARLLRRSSARCAHRDQGSGTDMISVENLTKKYGAATVVDDVSMTIERNSITVIVGTSGSGKSTLLRMINRLVEPTRGRVLIDGRDTSAEAPYLLRRRVGYAIQGHGLFPHRTVRENIATVPRLLGWDEARIGARVEELLEVFQLDPATYAQAFPHQLSGGQQQRVGVARALAAEPSVLLMDEPFGALDPIIRPKAQEDLLDIQRRYGTTIVLVTHDMDEAFHLGDRVAVMSLGRVLQYDRPAVLLTRPADPFVARMTGVSDRAMRLLSLPTAGEAALPGASEGPTVAASASLREVLSELLWRGAESATVTDADGTPRGRLTVAGVLARGLPSRCPA